MATDTAPPAYTTDSVLGGGLTLRQLKTGHRVGHDALLLAAFAPADRRRVVDLGAGVGSCGLAFLTRVPQAQAVLVEIAPELADLARDNAALNDLSARVEVVAGDVTRLGRPSGPEVPQAGAADLVLTNPPFNDTAQHRISPDEARARAHMADDALLEEWVRAADRCLAARGVLCLIHRPQALAAILAALDGRFGAVEILPVHPRPDRPAVRLLVRAVKGRRTPPALLPGLVLTDADGTPTAAADAVLRQGEGLVQSGLAQP
ncbi:tRNA1(Val) (adenine(37)-N6)-methyltransferase [Xanthobacter oligotrophicus]|uniref:tRNA1(Val) (adenine(37)-N6)-methyltransferase n=1 Tax=Xanthobacter oligotrophicus TaxID=2607286 RepID=UPI0011F15200|nr:methyltransferase [Xanthobacter oligotrophicus]MCG5236540.1 methyltransferase [Xanthobacter oligotrophicus]